MYMMQRLSHRLFHYLLSAPLFCQRVDSYNRDTRCSETRRLIIDGREQLQFLQQVSE